MRLTAVWARLVALSSCQTATGPPENPVVSLGYASYRGYTNSTSNITYFRGIPYAQPPIGPLRWRKPEPIEQGKSLQGTVMNATEIAPACYQSAPKSLLLGSLGEQLSEQFNVDIHQSEDCLTLDVLMPSVPQSKQLPVVVQIHGGGYTLGHAASLPGDGLVHSSNGSIISVSIQYRLGLFGFLGGSRVAEDGVLNPGLLDQRAALEWVQRNIRAFGGDPSRVTIWGGSAGGGSVSLQLTAHGASGQPPFTAAIAEYPWWQPMLDKAQQETQLYEAFRLSNCSSMECLRQLPSKQVAILNQAVQNASYPTLTGYGSFYYGPVVDGDFVREPPSAAFKKGRFHDVPLMVDHAPFEGYIFSNQTELTQQEQISDTTKLFPGIGSPTLSRLFQLHPRTAYGSAFLQRQTWFGDFIINCPTQYMASQAINHGKNASAVFKLFFAAGTKLHGATLPFVSNNDINWAGAGNSSLAATLSSYFVSFISTHDPNPRRLDRAPFWPSYAADESGQDKSVGFQTLEMSDGAIAVARDQDVGAKCDFFSSNNYVLAQWGGTDVFSPLMLWARNGSEIDSIYVHGSFDHLR